jgi:hypothetical protein
MKFITNNRVMLWIAFSVTAIGFAHSFIIKDFQWFQRIGSILVCIGILLLARPSFVNQPLLLPVKKLDSPYDSNDPEHYKYIGEPIPEPVVEDVKNRNAVNKYGPIITSFGTVIWGYGDLLGKLFY